MEQSIYKEIKKQNGEAFARILRDNNVLSLPNIIHLVKYAGKNQQDAVNLLPYLHSREIKPVLNRGISDNPFELLSMAGYDAFYANTEEKKNSIEHYFVHSEELCTFTDPTRHNFYYIIHAVHKDAASLKRRDFKKPDRQDKYGTSVISIQIAKDGSHISIKNRYNHTVSNPDSTFDNNPDNIIPGLNYALSKHFNINYATSDIPLPEGYIYYNNYIVKYNLEYENIYIGDGFYLNFEKKPPFTTIKKDYEIQFDVYILDLRTKKLRCLLSNQEDEFTYIFNKEIQNKNIHIKKTENNHTILIDNSPIVEIENGKMVYLALNKTTNIGSFFLPHNQSLRYFMAKNLTTIDTNFMYRNTDLETFDCPNLETIGHGFLPVNTKMEKLSLPNVVKIGSNFLHSNTILNELNLPNLSSLGDECLLFNEGLKALYLPNITIIGHHAFEYSKIPEFYAPLLKKIGDYFMAENYNLKKINTPDLQIVGDMFCCGAFKMTDLDLPKLEIAGNQFLFDNIQIETINLPKIQKIGSSPCMRVLKHIKKMQSQKDTDTLKNGIKILKTVNSAHNIEIPIKETKREKNTKNHR